MFPPDDDTLRSHLESGSPERILQALTELEERRMLGESFGTQMLSVHNLAALARAADYDDAARLAEVLLNYPGPPSRQGLDTLAELTAGHLERRPQHAVAVALNSLIGAPHAITRVLSTIGAQLDHLPPERALPIGFLIDNLLDGNPEVVDATWAALRAWPPGPMRDAVLRAAEVDLEAGRRSFQQRQVGG